MRPVVILAICVFSFSVYSQSGRKARELKMPVPLPDQPVNDAKSKPASDDSLPVTAEKNQDYRCSEDGSLLRILEPDDIGEAVASPKDIDVRAEITSKPKPSYTKEARRNGIQGFVILRVLLSARAKIARVRVLKGLPAGLTENALRAACKMEFKPARKDGEAVTQWVTAEYVFRLADSTIFTPWVQGRGV